MKKIFLMYVIIVSALLCACSEKDTTIGCIVIAPDSKQNEIIRLITRSIAKKNNAEYVDLTKVMGPGDDLSLKVNGDDAFIQVYGSTSINQSLQSKIGGYKPIPTNICFSGRPQSANKMLDQYIDEIKSYGIKFSLEKRGGAAEMAASSGQAITN